MKPSSRTPEGWSNRCPVCGKDVCIEPSTPPGDAPCPHCGHLLWFNPSIPEGSEINRPGRLDALFQLAAKQLSQGNYDYATELLAQCVLRDPGNPIYVQDFVSALKKKYGQNKKGASFAQFRERGARAALKKALSIGNWDEAIRNGIAVLRINPWDVPTLTSLATVCEKTAAQGDGPPYSGYADCEIFYLKCAVEIMPADPDVCKRLGVALGKRK